MLLDSKEFSLHQRWAEDLSHLCGAGKISEIQALQLMMSLTDTADQGVGIVEQSPENGHRMKQTQQRIKGTLKLKKQEMKFKRYRSLERTKENHVTHIKA